MKKLSKILLAFILAFCILSNVKAANYTISQVEGATLSIGGSCEDCFYDSSVKGYVNSFVSVPYSVNYGGGKYAAYCLDPGNPDISSVKVQATINANSTNKYHSGLYAIATSSSAYFNSNISSNNINKYSYSSTNLALRMWKIATGNAKSGGTASYVRAIGKTAADIMAENKSAANALVGKTCKNAKCYYDSFGIGGSYDSVKAIYGDAKKDVLPVAKTLFVEALNATSSESGNNNAVSSSIAKSTSVPVAKDNTSTNFVQKDYYDINVTNFSDENYVKDLTLTCENCNSISGDPTVSISRYSLDNGSTWSNGSPSNATLKTVTGTKKIVIEVTTNIKRNSGYGCEDVKIKLDYKYYAPTSDKSVLLLVPTTKNSNGQDFVAIIPNGSDDEDNIPVSETFDIIFCDNKCEYYDPKEIEEMTEEEFEDYTEECCTDLETLCNDETNVAQQDYCDLYSEYCGACDTKINHPTACTDYDDAGISSGEMTEALDDDLTTDNTKFCLLMRKKDEAGNSYKAFENNYCEVYCKEKFDYKLPGAVTLNSGTYFQLEATITGTKSCYTSKIDVNKFKEDIDKLNSKYSSYSSAYESEYSNIVDQYNTCVGLDETYSCFDPKIKYDYAEKYDDSITESNKEFKKIKEEVSNDETEHCTGEVDIGYNCQGTKSTGTISVTKKTSSGSETKTYQTADYVKTTITKKGYYKTPSVFYSKEQSGTIVSKEEFDGLAEADKNKYAAVDGLPVSIKTERGDHQFKLTLSNIGQYYDESGCVNGRLIGGAEGRESVFNKKNTAKAEYNCKYVVNCPECEFDCEGPLCEIDHCDGPDCKVTCLGNGCAYSEAGLSYAYRTVSLTNFNPTGRTLGYNWDTDTSKNKAAVKAEAALSEISDNGDGVYENEPLYTFKVTPALQTKIKEHNKSKLNKGGYADESLVCEDYTYDGKTYKNVNCKSKFIEELDSGEFGSNVTVPSSSNRFVNWFESDYCQTHVCTTTKGMGPSYK